MPEVKWLRCIRRGRDPHDPEAAFAGLSPLAAERRVIDVVGSDQELLEIHGQPAHLPVRYELLSWEWWCGEPAFDPEREWGYRMSERPVFDELPPLGPDGWRPGVKQISFLHRPQEISRDEFRELYHQHTQTLRDDQPGIAKYTQNVVESEAPGAREMDGVSELWFASLEDYRDRYWSGP